MNNISIKVMGRMEANLYTYKAKEKTIIISISDPSQSNIVTDKLNNNIIDILHLKFNDIDKPVNGCKLMNLDQAKAIKLFIDKYKYKDTDIKNIVVHCQAGISRSAAIACVISKYLFGSDDYYWNCGDYFPNKHCYKMCLIAFGLYKNDEEVKQKHRLNLINKSNSDYGITMKDMFCDVIINK